MKKIDFNADPGTFESPTALYGGCDVWAAFETDGPFSKIASLFGKETLSRSQIGLALYLKFQAFNIYRGGMSNLLDVRTVSAGIAS